MATVAQWLLQACLVAGALLVFCFYWGNPLQKLLNPYSEVA